jgi:sec-independent protein translocase protein TatC
MDPHVKSFGAHLVDLRGLLVKVFICLFLGVTVALPLAPRCYAWLKIPFDRADLDIPLRVTQVGGGFSIFLRVSLWSGLLICFPVLAGLIFHYLLPVMHRRERWLVWKLGGASCILFLFGSWLSYQWTIPVALRFMTKVELWMGTPAAFWEAASYIGFVVRLLIAFGIAFQLPVVVYLLGLGGFVTSAQLRLYRRHVICGLAALSMFLTPQDPYTMILMAVPLVILYEITIWLVFVAEKQGGQNEESADQPDEE